MLHEINLSLNNVETDLSHWKSYSYSLGHPDDKRLDPTTIEAKAKLTEMSVNFLIGQTPKITVQYSSNFFIIFLKSKTGVSVKI